MMDKIKHMLDRVKQGNPPFSELSEFADKFPSQSELFVKELYSRIQGLVGQSGKDPKDLKLSYFYTFDAILKKKNPVFIKAFEELVLPKFYLFLLGLLNKLDELTTYLILFFSWDGILNHKAMSECIKKFYSQNKTGRVERDLTLGHN